MDVKATELAVGDQVWFREELCEVTRVEHHPPAPRDTLTVVIHVKMPDEFGVQSISLKPDEEVSVDNDDI